MSFGGKSNNTLLERVCTFCVFTKHKTFWLSLANAPSISPCFHSSEYLQSLKMQLATKLTNRSYVQAAGEPALCLAACLPAQCWWAFHLQRQNLSLQSLKVCLDLYTCCRRDLQSLKAQHAALQTRLSQLAEHPCAAHPPEMLQLKGWQGWRVTRPPTVMICNVRLPCRGVGLDRIEWFQVWLYCSSSGSCWAALGADVASGPSQTSCLPLESSGTFLQCKHRAAYGYEFTTKPTGHKKCLSA